MTVKNLSYASVQAMFAILTLCCVVTGPVDAQVSAPAQRTGDARVEQAFLRGLTQLESGQPDAAVEQFLLILAQDPTLVRVRLELARAYYLSEQWDRARNEFFRVLSSDLPDPVRAKVLDFIRAIDARRGFDWDLSVGLVSLGNSRNYETDDVDLNIGGEVLPFQLNRDNSSEIGLGISGRVSYRKPLSGEFLGLQTVAFTSATLDIKEAKTSRYDDYLLTGRFGLRFLAPRTTFSIAPVLSTRYAAGELFENRTAWEAAVEHRGLLGGSVFGFASSAELHNHRSPTLDGYENFGEVGFRKSLSGRDIVGLSFYINDKNVDDNFENHITRGAKIFGSFTIKNGFVISPSVYYEEKSFRDQSPLLTGDADEDTYGITLRLEKNDLFIGNGFTPFVELEYNETKSGIDAYSFNESRIEAGLDRRF